MTMLLFLSMKDVKPPPDGQDDNYDPHQRESSHTTEDKTPVWLDTLENRPIFLSNKNAVVSLNTSSLPVSSLLHSAVIG